MFTFIRNIIAANKKTLKNNVGATMIEYALVVAAIVGVAGWWFVADNTGAGRQGITGAVNARMQDVATGTNGINPD